MQIITCDSHVVVIEDVCQAVMYARVNQTHVSHFGAISKVHTMGRLEVVQAMGCLEEVCAMGCI